MNIENWIKEALALSDTSQAELSRRLTDMLGKSIDRAAVNKMVSGGRNVSAEEMLAISRITGVAIPASLDDHNSSSGEVLPRMKTVPLRGYVEAGSWREVNATSNRRVEVPMDERYPERNQFALEVRGDSMNALKPVPIVEGVILRCVPWFPEMGFRAGQIVIVQRLMNGLAETTCKQAFFHEDQIELRPVSTNPEHKPIHIPRGGSDSDDEVKIIGLVTGIFYNL